MTKTRLFRPDDGFSEVDGIPVLPSGEGRTVAWVMLENPSSDELAAMSTAFHLHPMTVEDLEHDEDRPRLRQYKDVLSLVAFAVRSDDASSTEIRFEAINAFLGSWFLVTVSGGPAPELEEAWQRWQDLSHRLPADSGGPLYCVLDTIVDGYFPVVDRIADQVDDVEDSIIQKHSSESLPAIFTLRKSMLTFRHVAAGGRDVVNSLMVRDDVFSQGNVIYLQDVYDHVVRVTDSVDTYRDLLSNAMETYLSVASNDLAQNSNQLNITMQTLTSWSIIIGCAAFVTGVFGMNIENIPLTHSSRGFADVTLMIVGATVLLLALFRRKRWV